MRPSLFMLPLALPLLMTTILPSSAQWNGPFGGQFCCGPWAGPPVMRARIVGYGPLGRPIFAGPGFGPRRFGWRRGGALV